jgi:hypothetical protein
MMSRTLAATLTAILLVSSPAHTLQAAPTELASIPVSLTVLETCVVQSADEVIGTSNQPVVSCLHGAPFQITQAGFDPAPSGDTARKSSQPVEFVATHDAQQTVWTVAF